VETAYQEARNPGNGNDEMDEKAARQRRANAGVSRIKTRKPIFEKKDGV